MFTKMKYKLRNHKEMTMKEWSKETGIDINVLRYRWKKGDRGADLLRPCEIETSYLDFVTYDTGNGEETKTIKEWAEDIGIGVNTLTQRYAKGERGDVLFRRKGIHKKNLKRHKTQD